MPRPVKASHDNGTIYLGVDPGKSGGLAALFPREWVAAEPMPETERDILELLRHWLPEDRFVVHAMIERVSGYVGEGQPASRAFKFGQNYGTLRAFLIAEDIPFEEVTPQRWQKAIIRSKRARNESKTAWKNRCKAIAQQLFPQAKATLKTADAFLIAEYCRRYHQGIL